ncbi:enoyl-CoA hydratase-related protein [Methylobacterium nodulans]|uniref:enoyl-CoA hydratase n=1 Tax=Methylobacterium nodulans (strain LMG 21967 / CNCM I-2342 / ORS 2060) TaxID=460265 RepID=B8ISM6_METNO|nr:enoyl-CoA hydratase-related protein [Methylobacterium nodulans]ACL58866.1 Enoyl-CoA hydratase/isomerase [Methylobacterium nodulans ORS 2060]
MTCGTILTETHGRVRLVTLNRPKALNAINRQLTRELVAAAIEADADPTVGCIVVTGSPKAFAAGADIKEMAAATATEMYINDHFAAWEQFTAVRTPIIAAVAGYALGGGCELAMMCDFILAADTAKFGQPEIKLGVNPGIGGSQRLTRFIGKSKAMEMCLTGRTMDAAEAERCGLVSHVVPADRLLVEAINRRYETTLSEGVRFERRVFYATFATHDQKEGMTAFLEKRLPTFTHG